ncbi:Cell cycle control protein [Ruminococcus bromii]|nr:Cell cycle control protein [Ruminococcus bromii]
MWGRNYYGQLGVYSNADSKIPIKVNNSSSTLPEKSVKYIALGYYHSAAITKDGSLYMWGYNRSGQLGDGTTTDRYTPVKIMDNVASVSLGGSHSAAVTKDGSLYMWGDNGNGRLGDGTTTDRYTPVKIMDNVASVSLGSSHSAAITKDGSLYMWGYNYYGQLGDGTTTDRYTPVKIMDNVASVSLGGNHSAAITKDSNLYMWGGNGSGQLGDGTTDNKARPHRVASNVQSVKLGYSHTTVISKDGGLYTWGYNYYGQLGNGTTTDSSNPIKIMNDAIDCAGGDNHTIVLKKDGTVYTWGDNYHGQLGDDTTTDRTSPVAIQIYDHTNVLKSTKKSSESVSASSGQHTSKFAGYNANGIYNFYALKDKNADKLLSDDNILYVDQVRADSNGNISVTYTPKTAYDSPYEFVSSITQVNISNADVSAEDFTYNGKLQTVKPVVKVNGYTLYSGIDYTLSGAYIAKNAGEYTYTINGKGDFTGSITKTFTIKTADVNNCDVLILDSATYTGKDIEPNAVVKIGDVTLKKDVDYTVEYQNNLNVGIGIVVIKGKGNCNGRKICWFDITNCDISEISKIDIQDCTYYGKAVVPEMALENNGTALVKDKDYTVTFKNNDSVGTATAVINGIGNYSGTIEKTFQIKLPIGDIDMSETIDVKDATLVMQYGVKLIDLSDEQLIIADVNNDNIVNIKDATMIQKYVVKLIDSFVR